MQTSEPKVTCIAIYSYSFYSCL